jgi:hypothetical protein
MANRQRINKAITLDRVMAAVEREAYSLDNPGFCLSCGFEQDGCEPDARKYECESCGAHEVYGAEELLMMMEAP